MADNRSPITVGGEYVENPDHVPDPTDQTGQYQTSGTGANQKPEDISPVYAVDKLHTAQEILAATDPENRSVSADKVLLPGDIDAETALANIQAAAQARVDDGVVIGGPTPSEAVAAEEGEEGAYAAQQQIAENSRDNSTGHPLAGKHDAGGQRYAGAEDDTKLAAEGRGTNEEPVSKADQSETPTLSDDDSKATPADGKSEAQADAEKKKAEDDEVTLADRLKGESGQTSGDSTTGPSTAADATATAPAKPAKPSGGSTSRTSR